jgi:hypothetical protein
MLERPGGVLGKLMWHWRTKIEVIRKNP